MSLKLPWTRGGGKDQCQPLDPESGLTRLDNLLHQHVFQDPGEQTYQGTFSLSGGDEIN